MKDEYYEANFDGIVGPTHNYSGLAIGNVPSMKNKSLVSNPKQAALQGLYKMKRLSELGIVQGVLPPHERPYIPLLRNIGYKGTDREVLAAAYKNQPELYINLCSASSMWSANAAVVTPSIDTEDRLTHITPANLSSELHRSIEAETTSLILQRIFSSPLYFAHHPPLPANPQFTNEGAANHCPFYRKCGEAGIHLFVYGKAAFGRGGLVPERYPARETEEAVASIARRHRIFPGRAFFVQQSPRAIDLGVFHNDVISVSNQNFFLYHEHSFVSTKTIIEEISQAFEKVTTTPLITYMIRSEDLTIEEAVETYLFNSQIVTIEDGMMAIIAPTECQTNPRAKILLEKLVKSDKSPIKDIHYVNLRESMQNGGGPACLRLRIPLKRQEIDSITPEVLLTEKLYLRLISWVEKYYRDKLMPKDLQDPKLYEESRQALDELTKILNLGSIYSFQR